MYLHISSSLSLLNHPWISQNENCILVNSSLPLIRAFWDPLISPFWSPQHTHGYPNTHLTSLVTEFLLVLWGVSLPQGGGQSTTTVFWPGGHFTMGVKILSHTGIVDKQDLWCGACASPLILVIVWEGLPTFWPIEVRLDSNVIYSVRSFSTCCLL